MTQLTLRFFPGADLPDPEEIDALRADLNANVGPTHFAERDGQGQEKGTVLEVAALVVGLAGTPALPAMVNVLRSYFDLDKVARVEISGPAGSVKLKVQVGRNLSPDEIRGALETVLGSA